MASELVVGRSEDLGEGATLKFAFTENGDKREGFVVRWKGRARAYRNECRHIPVSLDWVENQFMSRDGCHLQCATHGALYEVDTGICIDGPPTGERLRSLDVVELMGDIIVSLPDQPPEEA